MSDSPSYRWHGRELPLVLAALAWFLFPHAPAAWLFLSAVLLWLVRPVLRALLWRLQTLFVVIRDQRHVEAFIALAVLAAFVLLNIALDYRPGAALPGRPLADFALQSWTSLWSLCQAYGIAVAAVVSTLVWIGESRRKYLDHLEKRLFVLFQHKTASGSCQVVLYCANAPLSHESDRRAFAQQLGAQLVAQRDLPFSLNIRYQDGLVQENGHVFRAYKVTYLLRLPPVEPPSSPKPDPAPHERIAEARRLQAERSTGRAELSARLTDLIAGHRYLHWDLHTADLPPQDSSPIPSTDPAGETLVPRFEQLSTIRLRLKKADYFLGPLRELRDWLRKIYTTNA